MTPVRPARPTASLFAQLLALIGLSLASATAISMLLIVILPPPVPDFYRLTEVVQTFRGERAAFGERRALVLGEAGAPPKIQKEGRIADELRRAIGRELRTPPERIVIGVSRRSPFRDSRTIRSLRERMAREGVSRDEHFLVAPFQVAIRRDDGRWTVVKPAPGFGPDVWQRRMLLWFLLSGLAMAPVAYLFARRLSAPIRTFVDAAERLGRDPRTPPLAVTGSAEINAAVRAFNHMQERLNRYVSDRTAMMGAIAHDLRTPLTRLRFRIENAPEDLRAKMAADLDQMEEMISAALAFVRDETRNAERTPLELSSLLESLCDEMTETGAAARVVAEEKVVVEGDPLALRRLFANLLDNAVKFGGEAQARIFREERNAVVEIADQGPGIPAEDAERVFEPFYRREPSRSRRTGGIGLGLAVVRSIARAHGGDVKLTNRLEGGLTARVQLPL